jgi:hypothetical protein
MWCVAELNEDYIAKMEDVLEIYGQPYRPQKLSFAWTRDRSPCMRMCVAF